MIFDVGVVVDIHDMRQRSVYSTTKLSERKDEAGQEKYTEC